MSRHRLRELNGIFKIGLAPTGSCFGNHAAFSAMMAFIRSARLSTPFAYPSGLLALQPCNLQSGTKIAVPPNSGSAAAAILQVGDANPDVEGPQLTETDYLWLCST